MLLLHIIIYCTIRGKIRNTFEGISTFRYEIKHYIKYTLSWRITSLQ